MLRALPIGRPIHTSDVDGDGCEDASEDICREDPILSDDADCPVVCTGGCDTGVCIIACDQTLSQCLQAMLVCPDSLPCEIRCGTFRVSKRSAIQCSDYGCQLSCTATSTCRGSELNCGASACSASCPGTSAGVNSVEAGWSCDLDIDADCN